MIPVWAVPDTFCNGTIGKGKADEMEFWTEEELQDRMPDFKVANVQKCVWKTYEDWKGR